jgi:anti-anti-sigma factor
MTTTIYLANGQLLVHIEGRVVLDVCDPLKKAVLAALTPAVSNVLVDLSKTEFIDSAGLGTLVGIKIKCNQIKARMTVVSPSPSVADVLSISKLNEIFEIATGEEAKSLVGSLASPTNLVRTVGGKGEVVTPAFQSPETLKIEEPKRRPKDAQTIERIEELCRNATEALRRGNYEESVRFYREAIEMDGEYLPARNNLAIVYEKRPEWRQKAIEQWEMVFRLSDQLGDSKHKERAEKHLQALRG